MRRANTIERWKLIYDAVKIEKPTASNDGKKGNANEFWKYVEGARKDATQQISTVFDLDGNEQGVH